MNKNNSKLMLKYASVLSREKCAKIMAGRETSAPQDGGPSGTSVAGGGGSAQTTCGVAPPEDDPTYQIWLDCVLLHQNPHQIGSCLLPDGGY